MPLRYFIQEHWAKAHHFDLRLEHNGVFLSWAIPKGLSLDAEGKRLAIQTPDHSHECATFEGEIPKGQYGAGKVELWDQGTFTPEKNMDEMIQDGKLTFTLEGGKVPAKWTIFHTKGDNWLIFKRSEK